METEERFDVVIVGARCAGAATGMLLARAGLRVLIVDRSSYGTDTLSTHALMRGGVLQLERWGLKAALLATGVAPVRTTTFHYGDEQVRVQIKPRDGVDALYAPRRSVLDALLVDAARKAGAEVRYGTRVQMLSRFKDGRIDGLLVSHHERSSEHIRADFVIGADGLRSTVARLVEASTLRRGRHASGLLYGYWSELDVEGYHWMYRPGASVGAIPTHDGRVCVFVALPAARFEREARIDPRLCFRSVLHEVSPTLAEAVAEARQTEPLRGFAGHVGQARTCWGPGWALVGDAGEFQDPLTAHGMTQALRDAELLARALVTGSDAALADYQAQREQLSVPLAEASDQIASFAWSLDELREHHQALHEGMAAESKALLALGAPSLQQHAGNTVLDAARASFA